MLLLIHTCDIARNSRTGLNVGRALGTLYSGVRCLALPMQQPTAIANGFDLGRGYDFYFVEGQDVKRGDQLTFSGNTYTVKALEKFELPTVGHLHVTAEQDVD